MNLINKLMFVGVCVCVHKVYVHAKAGAHKAGIFGSPENWSDSRLWACPHGSGE